MYTLTRPDQDSHCLECSKRIERGILTLTMIIQGKSFYYCHECGYKNYVLKGVKQDAEMLDMVMEMKGKVNSYETYTERFVKRLKEV